MKVNNKKSFKFFLWPALYLLLAVGICVFTQAIFNANYYSNFYVSGESMSPTLNGDADDADYGTYDGHNIAIKNVRRFQIVTTHYPSERTLPEEKKTLKIKRLLFKPGDTFEVVYLEEQGKNEMHLFENATSDNYTVLEFPFNTSHIKESHTYPKTTLSSTQYFVAGDNWDRSSDSFDEGVGPLEFTDLVGVVTKVEGRCKVVDKKITDKRPYAVKIFNGVDY